MDYQETANCQGVTIAGQDDQACNYKRSPATRFAVNGRRHSVSHVGVQTLAAVVAIALLPLVVVVVVVVMAIVVIVDDSNSSSSSSSSSSGSGSGGIHCELYGSLLPSFRSFSEEIRTLSRITASIDYSVELETFRISSGVTFTECKRVEMVSEASKILEGRT
uniref:Uncharacterized protein n=1 Tax=Vespula pensylvanica TaxID=30213 RepID=A0A834KM53_VESPE|nr:hypothetical protein H0235_014110 [Vespula pensylvanica]